MASAAAERAHDAPGGTGPLAGLAGNGWVFLRGPVVPMQRFQVLGERSSGTNFLTRVVNANTPLNRTELYGWKHGFLQFQSVVPGDLLLVSVRNARDWLLSMYRKPWHVHPADLNVSFAGFLRQPWRTVCDMPRRMGATEGRRSLGQPVQTDRHPLTGRFFDNPVQLRNAKMQAFLGLAERGVSVAVVRYESVRDNPAAFLAALGEAYGFAPHGILKLPREELGSMGQPIPGERREARPVFDDADRAFVAAELDAAQEACLGYDFGAPDGLEVPPAG